MKQYLFIIILLTLMQCKNDSSTMLSFNKVDNVAFSSINYPQMIGLGIQLIKVDSFLLVNDFFGDSLLNVYNLNQHEVKKKLISKGTGPDDMSSPLDMKICEDKLYILSRPRFHFAYYPLDCTYKKVKLEGHTQLPPRSDNFLPLNDSLFLLSGMWDKRYALYQKKMTDSIRVFGEFPTFWSEEKEFPVSVRAMFHQCQFVKHPVKNRFATCSSFVLEIYDYDPTGKSLPKLITQKQLGKYRYAFTDGDIITAKRKKEESDLPISGIACSNEYIYLIQSGLDDNKKDNILILDWNGNPIKMLKSDKEIMCLTIDEMNNKGYCVIQDPESKIVTFDL